MARAIIVALAIAAALLGIVAQPLSAQDGVEVGDLLATERPATCCVFDGRCFQVRSTAECDAASDSLIAETATADRADDAIDHEDVEASHPSGCAHQRQLAPALDTVAVRVLECMNLEASAAPATADSEQLDHPWYTCRVRLCSRPEDIVLAWPKYSENFVSVLPGYEDPVVGGQFLVRLEPHPDALRVREAAAWPGEACDE